MEISMMPSLEATLRQLVHQPGCTILGIVGAPNGVRICTQMDRAHRIIDSEGDFAARD